MEWYCTRKEEKSLEHSDNELQHYGILGMKWGIRRFQNPDGSLTKAGRKRYSENGHKSDNELLDEMDRNEQSKASKEYYSMSNIQRTKTPMAKAISKTEEYKKFAQLREEILKYPKGINGVSKELENSYWDAFRKLTSVASQMSQKYYGDDGIGTEELSKLVIDMNDLARDYMK